MKLVRALVYAPLWVLVLPVTLIFFSYMGANVALTGLSWIDVSIAALFVPGIGIAVAYRYRRYGGPREMHRFYNALRDRELPTLTTPEEVLRWNQLITRERATRRGEAAAAWMFLAVGVFCLLVTMLSLWKGTFFNNYALVFNGVLYVGLFAWERLCAPRVLADLDVLSTQGTTRGYGHSL